MKENIVRGLYIHFDGKVVYVKGTMGINVIYKTMDAKYNCMPIEDFNLGYKITIPEDKLKELMS